MIIDWDKIRIYIKPGYVDFRKQITGLSTIAAQQMKQDVFSGALFLFASKNRKRMKILYWDKTGFCLWTKRLEKDRFPWPNTSEEAMELTFQQMKMLLSGIDFFREHKPFVYKKLSDSINNLKNMLYNNYVNNKGKRIRS